MKEEHRNNYEDLNILNKNKVRENKTIKQETELKKINKIKCKKVELFQREAKLKNNYADGTTTLFRNKYE
jgi:hypothetical protein